MDVIIKENERVDIIDFNGLKIIQDLNSFRLEWMQFSYPISQNHGPEIRWWIWVLVLVSYPY